MPSDAYYRYFGMDPRKGREKRDFLMDSLLKDEVERMTGMGIPPDNPLVSMARNARDIYGREADNPEAYGAVNADPYRGSGLAPGGELETMRRYYMPPTHPSTPRMDREWLHDAHQQMDDTFAAQMSMYVPRERGLKGMDDAYTRYIASNRMLEARNNEDPAYVSRLRDEFFASNSGMNYPTPPDTSFWNTMYNALHRPEDDLTRSPWLPNEEVFPYTRY